jgi:IS1 family transposase
MTIDLIFVNKLIISRLFIVGTFLMLIQTYEYNVIVWHLSNDKFGNFFFGDRTKKFLRKNWEILTQ